MTPDREEALERIRDWRNFRHTGEVRDAAKEWARKAANECSRYCPHSRVPRRGVEPPQPDPESGVLPLDDRGMRAGGEAAFFAKGNGPRTPRRRGQARDALGPSLAGAFQSSVRSSEAPNS